jgi:hypothetical protein
MAKTKLCLNPSAEPRRAKEPLPLSQLILPRRKPSCRATLPRRASCRATLPRRAGGAGLMLLVTDAIAAMNLSEPPATLPRLGSGALPPLGGMIAPATLPRRGSGPVAACMAIAATPEKRLPLRPKSSPSMPTACMAIASAAAAMPNTLAPKGLPLWLTRRLGRLDGGRAGASEVLLETL